ncbi:hypothetical protein [Magnetovibrio blakemorei]|uniref:Uncharacterized protein n=1 Tax=Magnetovibrio blakemorei TaxID=28181 RepID=A0A1E5QB66_9PROT|nr:hypothetical protein [Magnetovibrio blakemorei]OEJ69258.1 hypothetical protein BEN30_04030 [Magnetovibrio blakemorei]
MTDTNGEPRMSLKTKATGVPDPASSQGRGGASGERTTYVMQDDSLPLLGMFAVGFGLLGIFTIGPVFVPLALIFGLIAIFAGQILWGLTALVLALAGFVTSPTLLLFLGAGALAAWLGIPL